MTFTLRPDEEFDLTYHQMALRNALAALDDALKEYTLALEEANDFTEAVHDRLWEEFRQMDAAWQVSDEGLAVREFIEAWSVSRDWDDVAVPKSDLTLDNMPTVADFQAT